MTKEGGFNTPEVSAGESSSHTSSEESSDSTPNTPPSPVVQLRQPDVSQIGRHSATGLKRSPKTPPSKSRLGAIDEDTDDVSPDVPVRNPLRRLGFPAFTFSLPPMPTLYATRAPPKNIYNDVEGPRGEKFEEVRKNNRPASRGPFFTWRKLICLGCMLLVLLACVAIGLIVGLTRKKANKNHNVANNGTDSGVNQGFPAGKYSISTYLVNTSSECTAYTGTWRCYPYQTYSQSATASFTTLNWIITAQNDSSWTISSADTLFSLSFQNVPLIHDNSQADAQYENYHFETTYDKLITPSTVITDDNSQARCFFNNTRVTGTLYTKLPKDPSSQRNATSAGSVFQPWPAAIMFAESVGNGVGIPDCYKYIDGQLGEHIDLNATESTGGALNCGCQYQNYFT